MYVRSILVVGVVLHLQNSSASRFDSSTASVTVSYSKSVTLVLKTNKQTPKTTTTKPTNLFRSICIGQKNVCAGILLNFMGRISLSNTLCCSQVSCACTNHFMPSEMTYNCFSEKKVLKTLLVSATTAKTG